MKITGKVKIKDNITQRDIASVVEDIVQFVFRVDENGDAYYAPYYMEFAEEMGILLNLVEGVEFEETDDFFNILNENKELDRVVHNYIRNGDDFPDMVGHAYDVIAFRQNEYFYKNKELDKLLEIAAAKEAAFNEMMTKLAETQHKVLNQQAAQNEKTEEIMSQMTDDEILNIQRRFANGEFDTAEIADMVVKSYLNNDKGRDQKYKDIIDEKNKTIIDLKEKIKGEQ